MGKQEGRLVVPKKGSDPKILLAFLDRYFDYESSYRREMEVEWSRNRTYVQGNQWLNQIKGDPRRAPRFTESSREDIPKPVTNRILPAVDHEISRLAKRNSETYVDASDASDPSSKATARVSSDVLIDHLDTISWPRKRRRAISQDVIAGTMILKSYLEQDNLDQVRIGVMGAQKCLNEGCDFRLAKKALPPEAVASMPFEQAQNLKVKKTFDWNAENPGNALGRGVGGTEVTTDNCLQCGAPMGQYTPDAEEAQGQDVYGQDLGKDVPKGKANVEVVRCEDAFPWNEGIDGEPENLQAMGQETPRSIDFIKRYYRKNVDKVKPEDPLSIAERHSVLGEMGAGNRGPRSVADRAVYQNHAMVREFYFDKTVEFPKGRMIVMANGIVLMDDDLYIDPEPVEGKDEGEEFPRVEFHLARALPKEGELWGQGLPTHAISLQNRINMAHSQVIDTRERHGVDGVLVTRGMKLTSPGWVKGFIGRVLHWEPDPAAPGEKPQPLGTRLMDDSVWKEIESAEAALTEILGVNAVQEGRAPGKGVTAASAIQQLDENASERRQQREKEIIDAFEGVFRHQLRLMQRYYREPRSYKIKSPHGYEVKEFLGVDLTGEVGVKVREQPAYDVKMAEREALSEAMQNPVFQMAFQTPYAQREAGKILGLPMNVLDQTNLQMDAASRKWFAFIRDNQVPVVDENLDDHTIHYNEYGRLMLSHEGVEMSEKVGWNQVLKIIAGWQPKLQAAQQQFAMYPQMQAIAETATAMGAPPLPPPPPEPPAAIQDAIKWQWDGMLMEKGMMATPDLDLWMQFRAAFEAHHMLAEGTAGSAAAGLPAPGAAPPMGAMPPGGAPPAPDAMAPAA